MAADESRIARALRQIMLREGYTDMKALSLSAGLGATYVRDIMEGKSKQPKAEHLATLAAYLGVTIQELMGDEGPARHAPDRSSDDIQAKRFKAYRWACWADDLEKAANALDIPVTIIEAIEGGLVTPADLLLTRMSERTGCPLGWVRHGTMEGMPPVMAARIGHFDLSLLPE